MFVSVKCRKGCKLQMVPGVTGSYFPTNKFIEVVHTRWVADNIATGDLLVKGDKSEETLMAVTPPVETKGKERDDPQQKVDNAESSEEKPSIHKKLKKESSNG